jgi:hypothetical protein
MQPTTAGRNQQQGGNSNDCGPYALPSVHAADADCSGNHSKIALSHLKPLLRIAVGFEVHNLRFQQQCLLLRVNPVQLARLDAPLPMHVLVPLTLPLRMAFRMMDLFNPVARAASPNV